MWSRLDKKSELAVRWAVSKGHHSCARKMGLDGGARRRGDGAKWELDREVGAVCRVGVSTVSGPRARFSHTPGFPLTE
jgi:hypothetical protein